MSEYLRALVEAAEDALERARDAGIEGAINWGDLHCVNAEHYHDAHDAEGYRVYIEEAAPDNPTLQTFVSNHLEGLGFNDIEVVTEW